MDLAPSDDKRGQASRREQTALNATLTDETLAQVFNAGLARAQADEHISHREARNLGRELGILLATQFHHLVEQSGLRHLIATSAQHINESALLPEQKASCWSNLRKAFIGDTETFTLGQARSAIIDAVEMELPHLRGMFYPYPNLTNPIALENFEALRKAIDERFPTLSQQAAHESTLILCGLGQTRGLALGDTHERFARIAPNILVICEAYLRENPALTLVSLLRPLSRIAAIYDRASGRIAEGQRAQTSFKESYRLTNRFDLLGRIARVDQLAVLIAPTVQTAASSLVSRGSYIGRLYLNTLVEFPQYQTTLHISYPQTKHLLESHYASLAREPERAHSALPISSGVGRLKQFTTTSYINIGLECLNQASNAPQFHADSSRDVALLSEFIFEKVSALEFDRLTNAHGIPSSRHGFIGGGANARREYPSFDYDWFLAYEREGETSATDNQIPVSNHAFFTKLSRAVNTTLSSLGANSDGAYFPHHPISLEAESAVTKDRYQHLLASSPDPHMELRLRVNMIALGGDRAFCDEWLNHLSMLTKNASAEIMQNQARVILNMSRAEPTPERLNVKTSPGGLRLGTHLWILCATAYSRSFDSFENLTDFLASERLISQEKATALTSSYLYLLQLRVRMDMQYGRNDKDLPAGEELSVLAKSLGLGAGRNGITAESILKAEALHAMKEMRSIIGGNHSPDGALDQPGLLQALRDRLMVTRGVDILDHSTITTAEERSRKIRLDYSSAQAARAENLWI